jgi:hypothetical protein
VFNNATIEEFLTSNSARTDGGIEELHVHFSLTYEKKLRLGVCV